MELEHFSHPHKLHLLEVQDDEQINCSGCELSCLGSVYNCTPCEFFLHKSCAEFVQTIQHPSHPQHPLSLLIQPSPSYYGSFSCNACDLSGGAFNYNCATCEFDLHVHCASFPHTIEHYEHAHPLTLTFSLQIDNYSTFYCQACNRVACTDYWIYYCADCDFGTHLECATSEEPQQPETEELDHSDDQSVINEGDDGDEERSEDNRGDDDEEQSEAQSGNDKNDDDEDTDDSDLLASLVVKNMVLGTLVARNNRRLMMNSMRQHGPGVGYPGFQTGTGYLTFPHL